MAKINNVGGVNAAGVGGVNTQPVEGHIGKHTVQIAGNPPIRLDKVGTYDIPRQGILRSTQLKRALDGAREQAAGLMTALQRNDGKLDATAVLKSLNTFQLYLGKIQTLDANNDKDFDMLAINYMTLALENMSNSDLLRIYETLVCRDFQVLRQGMEVEAHQNSKLKGNLMNSLSMAMDLEALVVCEVSRRVSVVNEAGQDNPVQVGTLGSTYAPGMSTRHSVLVAANNVDVQPLMAAATMERAAGAERLSAAVEQRVADFQEQHNLTPITPKQVGDVLRQAELTINIGSDLLFGSAVTMEGDSFPVNHPGFTLKNMFGLIEEGKYRPAGVDYAPLRTAVEEALFPGLRGHQAGNERPVYGALNVTQNLRGAASSYGDMVVVLREHVKQEATYTLNDTLEVPVVHIRPEQEAAFVQHLKNYGDLLRTDTHAKLDDPNSQLRQQIHGIFSEPRVLTLGRSSADQFSQFADGIKFKKDGDKNREYLVKNAFMQCCVVPFENQDRAVAFDSLENLIAQMDDPNLVTMLKAGRKGEKSRVTLGSGIQYIEAQIAKPITVSDIAEIRLCSFLFTGNDAGKERVTNWCKEHDIKLVILDDDTANDNAGEITQAITDDVKERLQVLSAELEAKAAAAVTRYTSPEWIEEFLATQPDLEKLLGFCGDNQLVPNFVLNNVRDKVASAVEKGKTTESALGGGLDLEARVAATKVLNSHLEELRQAEALPYPTPEMRQNAAVKMARGGTLVLLDIEKRIHCHNMVQDAWVQECAATVPGYEAVMERLGGRLSAEILEGINTRVYRVLSSMGGSAKYSDLEVKAKEVSREMIQNRVQMLVQVLDNEVFAFASEEQRQVMFRWLSGSLTVRNMDTPRQIFDKAAQMSDFFNTLVQRNPIKVNDVIGVCLAIVNSIFDDMTEANRGVEVGKDDIIGVLDRNATVGISLALAAIQNPADRQRLVDALCSPEMRMYYATLVSANHAINGDNSILKRIEKLAGEEHHRDAEGRSIGITGNAREFTPQNDLISAQFHWLRNLLTNLTGTTPPNFRLDYERIPQWSRDLLYQTAPFAATVLDEMVPMKNTLQAVPNIPAPQQPVAEMGFDARRNFLIQCLEGYRDHERTFDKGTEYHGRTHATRSFIFATVMANILRERGLKVDLDAVAMATAAHDIGRTKNGTDTEEHMSAQRLKDIMGDFFDTGTYDDEYMNAVSGCIDTKNSPFSNTIEAMVMKSADSLDYGRLAPFDSKLWPFLQDDIFQVGVVANADEELRIQLANEARLLEDMTYPLSGGSVEMMPIDPATGGIDMSRFDIYQGMLAEMRQTIEFRTENEANAEVVERIENCIRSNPTLFPTLNKYYFEPEE